MVVSENPPRYATPRITPRLTLPARLGWDDDDSSNIVPGISCNLSNEFLDIFI